MSIIKIWLKSVAGQLSDKPKIFAGQNKNLPVLSDSPAVFLDWILFERHWVAVPAIGVQKLDIIYQWYCHKAIYNLVEKARTRICPSLFKGPPT